MESVVEKLKEALLTVENWGAQASAWFDGVFPPETRAEKLKEVMKTVVEKHKEALLTAKNWGSEALAWFDRVFPLETRADKINHWFHVAKPYLIAAVVLYAVVCFCRCCCGGGGGGGGRVKMMKAPGKNRRMLRSDFEKNPKDYFRKLRSKPGK